MNRQSANRQPAYSPTGASRPGRRYVRLVYSVCVLTAAMLIVGTFIWRHSAAADQSTLSTIAGPPKNPVIGFSQTTVANPVTVASGATTTITATILVTHTELTNGVIDIEIYNAAKRLVGRQYWNGQTLQSNQAVSHSYTWTALEAGSYQVAVGVFGPGRSPSDLWAPGATALTVTSRDSAVLPLTTATATVSSTRRFSTSTTTSAASTVTATPRQSLPNTTSTMVGAAPASVTPMRLAPIAPSSAIVTLTGVFAGRRWTPVPPSITTIVTPPRPTSTHTRTVPIATVSVTPITILGYTTVVGGRYDTGNKNNLSAVRVTTGVSGASVKALSVYVGPIDSGNPAYGMAIYTDSGRSPNRLVAGASGSLTKSGWNTLPIATTLASNTNYWLVYNARTSNINLDAVYLLHGAANIGAWSRPVTCCAFPGTASGWTTTNMQYAMYASLSNSGVVANSTATSRAATVSSTPRPVATSTTIPSASATPASHLVFDDEFTGSSLNTALWSALNRPGDSSNSEQECYLPSNASIVSGALVLTDTKDTACNGHTYTSAMVQTKRYNFTYGRLEVRAQMPRGAGQWPALWLLGANCQAINPTTPDNTGSCQWPTPGSNEIDMFEGKSSLTTSGFFSLVTGTSPNTIDQGFNCTYVPLAIDTSTGYHTYDLIWKPGSLTWQIDGRSYCAVTTHVPTSAMFLILNVALGGSFSGGTIDSSVLPQAMHIDYVRIYQG